jgi:hypothetical protein
MRFKTSRDDYISTKNTLAAILVWLTLFFEPPSYTFHFHIKYNLLEQGARRQETRGGEEENFSLLKKENQKRRTGKEGRKKGEKIHL